MEVLLYKQENSFIWDQGSSHSHTKRLHACMCVSVCVWGLYVCLLLVGNLSIVKKSFFSILSKDLVEWDFFFWGETWEKLIWEKYICLSSQKNLEK